MSQLTVEHIETLVKNFYLKIQFDDVLGPIFNHVAQVDWDHHIPLLCQFWNSIMLKTKEYRGNAFRKHVMLAEKIPLTHEHFDRWLTYFREEAFRHLPSSSAQDIIAKASVIAESLKAGIMHAKGL